VHATDGTFTPYQEFVIQVDDPCDTATLSNTGITSMVIINGVVATQEF
jgi:hypothetical protein